MTSWLRFNIPHFNPEQSYGYWLDGGTLQHGLHLSAGAVLHQLVTAAPTKLTTVALVLLVTVLLFGFVLLLVLSLVTRGRRRTQALDAAAPIPTGVPE